MQLKAPAGLDKSPMRFDDRREAARLDDAGAGPLAPLHGFPGGNRRIWNFLPSSVTALVAKGLDTC